MRTALAVFTLAFFVNTSALNSQARDQKQPEKSKEEKKLPARCKAKLVKDSRPKSPGKWELGKDEKYRGHPVVTYTVEEDGSVDKVKLKGSSGVREIDNMCSLGETREIPAYARMSWSGNHGNGRNRLPMRPTKTLSPLVA